MFKVYKSLLPVYRVIPGYYWAIIGGAWGIIEIIIAMILHSLTEPITFFSHFVSNLGIGPNGSGLFWNISSFLCALMLIPFMPYLTNFLLIKPEISLNKDNTPHKQQINLLYFAFWISMISAIGLMLVSAFTMDSESLSVHSIGAMMFFFGDQIFMLIYTILMHKSKILSKILMVWEIFILLMFVGMTIAMIVPQLGEIGSILSISPGVLTEALSNMGESFKWIRFFEWILIFSMLIWFVLIGNHFRILEKEKKLFRKI